MSKSFKQLKEELVDLVNDPFFNTKHVPIYVNPSGKELGEIVKGDFDRTEVAKQNTPNFKGKTPVRGLITKDLDLYLWHGLGGTHLNVRKKMKLGKVLFVSGYIDNRTREIFLAMADGENEINDFVEFGLKMTKEQVIEELIGKNPSLNIDFQQQDMEMGFS